MIRRYQSSMGAFAFWPVVFVFVLFLQLKKVVLFLFIFSYFIKSYFVIITHKYVYKNVFSYNNIKGKYDWSYFVIFSKNMK